MKGKFVVFLGAMIVAVAVVSLGTAFAAPDDNSSSLDSGLLDPFTLNTIDILSTAGLSDSKPSMVRIPFRPTLRSPFRPPLN